MESFQIIATRQKFAGIFSLSSYYSYLYDVFRRMGYEVWEIKYRLKNIPGKGELELFWECYKKIDSYVKLYIFAKTLIVGLEDKEVNIEGVNVTRQKGDVELEMKAQLQTDYANTWETNPLLLPLKPIYDSTIYRPKFKELEATVAKHLYTVENEIKAFFKMETFS
jgi:hypothetical protein